MFDIEYKGANAIVFATKKVRVVFDPNLAVIGTASYFILGTFSKATFVAYAIIYPLVLGAILLVCGYLGFSKRDLV